MYKKQVDFMKKIDEESFPESIEVGGRKLRFQDTKTGKMHMEFVNLLLDSKQLNNTIMTPQLREALSQYLSISEASILYNMKAYLVMQEFVEGLLLTQCMTQTGKIVGVTFPEQREVLQKATDKMLALIGKKINQEG